MADVRQKLLEMMRKYDPSAKDSDVDQMESVVSQTIMPALLMAQVALLVTREIGLMKGIAETHKALYDAYKEVGFSAKEAFELVKGYGNPVSPKESK